MRFRILSWCAALPGGFPLRGLAPGSLPDPEEKLSPPRILPMMAVRRLSPAARAAAECAASASGGKEPGYVVFASRHAELPRSEKLLTGLARGEGESPADFSMSVHNAAAGSLCIGMRWTVPVSSVAAGAGTFSAGLAEAVSALAAGSRTVLLACFENAIPPVIGSSFSSPGCGIPFAVAFLLAEGPGFLVQPARKSASPAVVPAPLQLARELERESPTFSVTEEDGRMTLWSSCDGGI